MSNASCMLCSKTTNDALNLGEKITKRIAKRNITVHHYCLLLSKTIQPRYASNKGILGYSITDIKSDAKRNQEKTCYICNETGANIRCCESACERAFHLTCGLHHGCQFQFNNMFDSFCRKHRRVEKPTKIHESNELCIICHDEMGTYSSRKSVQSPCCSKNSWYHKKCLLSYAKTSANSTKCPLCNDIDLFCRTIQNHGIFIPEGRASWKDYDPFYDTMTQFTGSIECSANVCRCQHGRDFESSTNLFIFCYICGAKAIHRRCLSVGTEFFMCDECQI